MIWLRSDFREDVPVADEVLVTKQGACVNVTLNRPQALNAITSSMKARLLEVIADAEDDASLAVLVLQGAGRAFCSGADLSELESMSQWDTVSSLRRLEVTQAIIRAMRKSRLAIVTVVHGMAAGGGVALGLAGDVVLASQDASFMLVFGQRHLVPDAALSDMLISAVGARKALSLSLLSQKLTADEARGFGLVDKVCDANALDLTLSQTVASLVEAGPETVLLMKRVFVHEDPVRNAVEGMAQALAFKRDK